MVMVMATATVDSMDITMARRLDGIMGARSVGAAGAARPDYGNRAAVEAAATRFDYEETQVQALPMKFPCPSVVMREGETNSGAVDIFQPWADAVAEN